MNWKLFSNSRPKFHDYIVVDNGNYFISGYFQGIGNKPKSKEDAIIDVKNNMPVYHKDDYIWFVNYNVCCPLFKNSKYIIVTKDAV